MKFEQEIGGIGVAIMMYETELERELKELSRLLDGDISTQVEKMTGASDELKKFSGCAELKKTMPAADYAARRQALADRFSAELVAMNELIAKANEIAKRRNASLPDFRRWALGQHAGAAR
jgi:hypothetical protein